MTASSSRAPAVIVGTERSQLAHALTAAGLPVGRPVAILIGGAAKLDAETATRVEPLIRDGVIAVAQALGATLLDGGTDAGAMRLAGRAHAALRATVPLVGVAPAGRVQVDGVDAATGPTEVEPNHTHLLLAPGSEWADESPWLVDAARLLSGDKPVVAVVVDGGQVASVEATKCRAEGWPVIVIAGSGRTADDLARLARRGGPAGPADSGGIHVTDLADGAPALAAMLRSLLTAESPPRSPPEPRARILYPALYVTASEASKRGKRLYKLLAIVELALVIGALLTTTTLALLPADPSLPPGMPPPPGSTDSERVAVLAIAGAFLAAFVIKFLGRSAKYDDDWFVGRAIAESVKSASWRYMLRVPPYAADTADERFAGELSSLGRRAGQIRQAVDRLPSRPQQISPLMREVRALDLPARRDFYVSRRVLDQADWYARRGAGHRRSASRWFWVSVFLQLGAAITALMALAMTSVPILLRVMSLLGAAAVAVTAWTQLNRDEELAKSYAATMQELLLVAERADRVDTERELAAMVDDAEEAIGRENRTWVAKRAERTESTDLVPSD